MRVCALSVRKKEKDSHLILMVPIIAILILCVDQLTKFIIHKNLLLNQSFPIIKGIFHLTLIHNRGAAFGILKNQIPIFIFTSVLAVILIYFYLRKDKSRTCAQGRDKRKKLSITTLSLSLILGGALGNLIDRIFLGYVVDFLDFRVWPVFNLADSAITIGVILFGYSILNSKKNVSHNL